MLEKRRNIGLRRQARGDGRWFGRTPSEGACATHALQRPPACGWLLLRGHSVHIGPGSKLFGGNAPGRRLNRCGIGEGCSACSRHRATHASCSCLCIRLCLLCATLKAQATLDLSGQASGGRRCRLVHGICRNSCTCRRRMRWSCACLPLLAERERAPYRPHYSVAVAASLPAGGFVSWCAARRRAACLSVQCRILTSSTRCSG